MTDSRPVLKQYNELLGILGRFTQHKMNMDESIQVSCIIDKLPPSWKDFKHTLKHLKEELTLVELGSICALRSPLGRRIVTSQRETMLLVYNNWTWLNIVNDNIGSAFMSTFKLNDSIIWFCYVSLLHTKDEALDKLKVFKTEVKLQQRSLIKRFRTDRGGECMDTLYFQTESRVLRAVHSKAFRFFVIEPNDSVAINSIIKSKDVIFDENRFSSVLRPSFRIPNRTEDIGGSVVPEEDDPKTFDEAMKSQDVAFWKEAINDEMDSIMGNNTWVLADLPLRVAMFWLQMNLQIRKIRLQFNQVKINGVAILMKTGQGEADVILVSTPMDTSEKLMPNNGQVVSQLSILG
ncbi:zinc finger, CCHC-type containing protein [Tanacetum coccineum]|uniref:Zinc finger, CCHC-type containing protein n=1 Tax=Tanacetum coccineum TaxID=301880 RepID=A0ABQ5AVU9_9ASTR